MHIAFCDNNVSFLNHLSKMVREHLHKLKLNIHISYLTPLLA